MKSLILILLWASSIFFLTLCARDSNADEPFYQYANVISKRCIGVDHASTSSGAYIKQFTCDGSDNQKWQLLPIPSTNFVSFRNKKSRMCMGVDYGSTYPNADIRQFPCDYTLNQQWFFQDHNPHNPNYCPAQQGSCVINVKSKLCLDVDQASTANGVQLKQFFCNGYPDQFWQYQ